jgi:hypothetical protein
MREQDPRAGHHSTDLPRVRYWELERRRVSETRTLGKEFDRVLREFAPTVPVRRNDPSVVGGLDEVAEIWRRAVGDEIASLSRPGRFRGGVLTVEVDSAPLASELEQFAREHLLEALEREGLVGLCDLKFRGGRNSS